jgi:hypothetical protein
VLFTLGHCRSNPTRPEQDYLSVGELYDLCQIPGPCGKQLECEGKVVYVKGYIDYDNVFDKTNYPQLPYEKFKIYEKEAKSIEVWPISEDNEEIFAKIHQNKGYPEKIVQIKGIVEGFDMPTQNTCHRGIKIKIEKSGDICFKE